MSSRRTEQVSEEIHRHISELLLREVRDPRIGFVTVTGVDVSPDLEHARVHVSVLGSDEEERDAMRALRRAAGFLRTSLGKRMKVRKVPELRFEADRSARHAIHISKLIAETSEASAVSEQPSVDSGQPSGSTRLSEADS